MSLGSLFGGLWRALTGKKAQEVVKTAVSLVDQAAPLLKIFATASGNVTLQSVVAGYETVGLEVTDALRDGKLTPEELKAMAGLGVRMALEKSHKVSGSEAGLAGVLAFVASKYGN